MTEYTVKNGQIMTNDEAARVEREPSAKRAAQLARASTTSVKAARQNQKKKGDQ